MTCPEGATAPGAWTRDLRRCGPYELLENHADGALAFGFRGRRDDGTVHAVWVSHGVLDADGRARFLDAASRVRAARLDHPGLARQHDAGALDTGHVWSSEDLVVGEDVGALLSRDALSRAAGLDVLLQVGRAIGHAHVRGVVHGTRNAGDLPTALRPDMVVVPRRGPTRVLGYGVHMGLRTLQLRMVGMILGDSRALPPEVVGEVSGPGAAADVFVLGALLFRLLTRRWPFEGRGLALMRAIFEQPAPRPSAFDPTVPAALDEVCLHALAKDPARRPPHGEAFADELVAAMAEGRAPVWTPDPPRPDGGAASRPAASRPSGVLDRVRRWLRPG